MEECFTQNFHGDSNPFTSSCSEPSEIVENPEYFGPKETTLAALMSFARAYRAVNLSSMPTAPGMILN